MKKIIKDPGVLFGILHCCAFAATAGASSVIFGLSVLSLGISSYMALRKEVFGKGTPLLRNGQILGVIALVSAFTANPLSAVIAGLFSVSNMSKGLEMNGSQLSLKSIGNKYIGEGGGIVEKFIKNTFFSAEAYASAGAFVIGFSGAGILATIGGVIAGTSLTLAALGNSDPQKPVWKKLLGQKISEKVEKNLGGMGDPTIVRYTMAGVSLTYAFSAAVAGVAEADTIANTVNQYSHELIVAGNLCAAYANTLIGNFMRANDNEKLIPSALQNQCGGQPAHRQHRV